MARQDTELEMYHNIKDGPVCSACGSRNSESFYQRIKSGRRCLNCGHEATLHTVTTTRATAADGAVWIRIPERDNKF